MLAHNLNLKHLNTFKVDSIAERYFKFHNEEDLDEFAKEHLTIDTPYLILGRGSNLLLSKNFNGVVLHPTRSDISVLEKTSRHIIVRAYAGLEWDNFVKYCVDMGWQGVENLTLVPGNVGAAPVQNIGAYGTEVSECIRTVNCYDLKEKKLVSLTNQECNFSYRYSVFKTRPELLIISVDFQLYSSQLIAITAKKNKIALPLILLGSLFSAIRLALRSVRLGPSTRWKIKMNFSYVRDFLLLPIIPISLKRRLVKSIRQKTMPAPDKIGNVGCFFKSPIISEPEAKTLLTSLPSIQIYPHNDGQYKVSASDLIKACGWDDRRIGDVSVDKNRPIVILNHGSATGSEIYKYSQAIQKDIHEKFNLTLEAEVVII